MQRYRIHHVTAYEFAETVRLGPHALRLRPREGHELRIESSSLSITPAATLRWHRDAEDNCVAIGSFEQSTSSLVIESAVVVQQYNEDPLDFVMDEAALFYPFSYGSEDLVLLTPYCLEPGPGPDPHLAIWLASVWQPGERLQTFGLLERLNTRIHGSLSYQRREEPGVRTPAETLTLGSGSCRDFANLFMVAARQLGLAARFVSGYLHAPGLQVAGSTHAWAEVYLPDAGWTGFDPTIGALAGPDHMAVAVARHSEAVPPVAGSYEGPPGAQLTVTVNVSRV